MHPLGAYSVFPGEAGSPRRGARCGRPIHKGGVVHGLPEVFVVFLTCSFRGGPTSDVAITPLNTVLLSHGHSELRVEVCVGVVE